MSDPLTEHLGLPGTDPQSYQDYLRSLMAQQANTTGLTQMAPSTAGAQPPAASGRLPEREQQTSQFGVGGGGAHQRESMQNLVKSAQSLANTITQAVEAKKQRQYQQVIGRYTATVAGLNQAQGQVQQGQQMIDQAKQRLAKNPQDENAQAMAKAGAQMVQQGQQALQQNQTNLNDIASDPKQHKIIAKAYGIDDKNANSPERQALIQTLQKSMGIGPQAASLASRMPQTQQLSPEAQQQQIARQAGVVGAPATQGQLLSSATKMATTATTEAGKDKRLEQALEVRREALGLDEDGKPLPLENLPLEKRAKIEEERASEDYKNAATAFMQARQQALTDPNSPGYKLAVLRTEASMLGARARMMGAVTSRMNYDMRAFGTDEDGKPLPGTVNVGGMTVGTAVAPNLEKVMTQQATFTDVRGAMKNLEASTLDMQQSGVSLSDPAMVKFLTDIGSAKDKGTIDNLITGMVGRGLNSQQQDYARNYAQAVENISALRGILKGSVAQANIERMVRTLPGPGTPNYAYALGQIHAIYGQLDRLQTGIPGVNANPGTAATPPSTKPRGSKVIVVSPQEMR